MCTAVRQYADFDQLLPAFLAGDSKARNLLPRTGRSYLLKVAAQLARDLPQDMLDEVLNQTFEKLLKLRPGSFDPDERRAGTFMGLVMRDAVRDIRAAYAPPGLPKRKRKPKAQTTSEQFEAHADETIDNESEAEAVDVGPTGADALIEEFADPTNTVELIEIRLDLRKALTRAPYPVAMGLTRQYLCGDGLGEVATAMGLSRFALNRQINRFLGEMQALS